MSTDGADLKAWAITVGANMRRAREAMGITQLQAARLMGHGNSSQISLTEMGRRAATPKMIAECAAVYRVAEEDLTAKAVGEGINSRPPRRANGKKARIGEVTIREAIYAVIKASPGISTTDIRARLMAEMPEIRPLSIPATLQLMRNTYRQIVGTRTTTPRGAQLNTWRLADAPVCDSVAVAGPAPGEVLGLLRKSLEASDPIVSRSYISCAVALLTSEERIAA